ncbi:MAG: sterol desaturase family protein [Pseudomonadota bacterium]
MSHDQASINTRKRPALWNFTPALPIKQAPYCEWPIDWRASIAYLLDTWRPFSQRFFILLIAIVAWVWFTPAIERAVEFEAGWMLEVGLRNLVIVLVVAGGLHLSLHTFSLQGDDTRYDPRPLARKSRKFHFNNQVWDNMFWTLFGSVPIGTLWECLLLWGYANGYATLITFESNPYWFVGLMLLVPIWSGFHFYWFHRLMHVGPLFRWFHSWHHKNDNTGPWSGHAMHPVEHAGLYSDLAIYFLMASHPVHMIFNSMLHTIAGPTSHCGYDKVKITPWFSLHLGDYMHQLHHRFVECNYGSYETPWDKIFGSFHDGTDSGMAMVNERRRRLLSKR